LAKINLDDPKYRTPDGRYAGVTLE